jgi:CHAD domain-containing protein
MTASIQASPPAAKPGFARTFRPPAALLPHITAALKSGWRDHRRKLSRCQHDFSEKAVHQTRVATRRLLSLVELQGHLLPGRSWRKACRALKLYLDHFGNLRDAHVQLQAVETMMLDFPELSGFRAALRKEERRCANKARKKVRNTKLRKLDQWIAELKSELRAASKTVPANLLSAKAIAGVDSAFARVVKLRSRIDPEDSETIHRTRLAFKKFRYLVEVLAPLLPGVNQAQLKAMHHYQSVLGEVQDAEVLLAGAERFFRQHKSASPFSDRIQSELSRRRLKTIRVCLRMADHVYHFWPLPRDKEQPKRQKKD